MARDIKSAIENQGGETHAEIRAARNEITKRLEAAAVQFDLRVKGKKAKK